MSGTSERDISRLELEEGGSLSAAAVGAKKGEFFLNALRPHGGGHVWTRRKGSAAVAAIEEEKEEEANQGGGDTKGIICTNSLFNSRRKQEGSPLLQRTVVSRLTYVAPPPVKALLGLFHSLLAVASWNLQKRINRERKRCGLRFQFTVLCTAGS